MSAPKHAAPLTQTVHHDVYDAISPTGALAGSAEGLVVVITGAGRGIGRAHALAFAQAGARRVVIGARSTHELDEVTDAIAGLGLRTEVINATLDVTDEASVDALFAQVPDVNVLINNAAALEMPARIHEADPAVYWRTWEVNVKGTFLPTRAALRTALARPQRPVNLTVLNTSSIGAAGTRLGASAYQPTKSAVNRFTEFLHFEYAPEGVRAFAFHPGSVLTKLAREGIPPELHHLLGDTPALGAGFALWLATQGPAVDFLRGRYVACSWDVGELLAMRAKIEGENLLWTRVLGQEQVHE